MDANNQKYRFFKQMMEGYKAGGNDGDVIFSSNVINWMKVEHENPFIQGSPEHTYFDRMLQHYAGWQRNATGSRYSRVQILEEARNLCENKTKNPYKFDRKADEQDKREKQQLEAQRQAAIEEANRKAIEAEAERIVMREEQARIEAERKEKERLAKEKEMADKQAASAKQKEMLKQAIEAKRAALKQESTYVFGVIPEEITQSMDEQYVEAPVEVLEEELVKEQHEEPKKQSFIKRLFGKLGGAS